MFYAVLVRFLSPISTYACVPQGLVSRLKENLEKMVEERDHRVAGENREKDQNKRIQRQIRDMKEEMAELSKKEGEASRKKHELVSAGPSAAGLFFTPSFSYSSFNQMNVSGLMFPMS